MRHSVTQSVDKYIKAINKGNWVADEAYKFEFANFINQNVDWTKQSNDEILKILIKSQKIKYIGNEQ